MALQTATAKKFNTGWYLVYTKPRHEKKVYEQLSHKNINALLPTVKILRQWWDRKKLVTEPMFPSYVFLYLQNSGEYYDVLDTEGVLKYVRFGKEISKVPESVIQNLIILNAQQHSIEVTQEAFVSGQRVLVKEGPLEGIRGEVINYRGSQKILVRISILMRNLLIDVSPEWLTADMV